MSLQVWAFSPWCVSAGRSGMNAQFVVVHSVTCTISRFTCGTSTQVLALPGVRFVASRSKISVRSECTRVIIIGPNLINRPATAHPPPPPFPPPHPAAPGAPPVTLWTTPACTLDRAEVTPVVSPYRLLLLILAPGPSPPRWGWGWW